MGSKIFFSFNLVTISTRLFTQGTWEKLGLIRGLLGVGWGPSNAISKMPKELPSILVWAGLKLQIHCLHQDPWETLIWSKVFQWARW